MKTLDMSFFADEREVKRVLYNYMREVKKVVFLSEDGETKYDFPLDDLKSRTIWIRCQNNGKSLQNASFLDCPMILLPKLIDKELWMGALAIKYTDKKSCGYAVYINLKNNFLKIFSNGVIARNLMTGASRFYRDVYYSEEGRRLSKAGYFLRSRYGDGNIRYEIDATS